MKTPALAAWVAIPILAITSLAQAQQTTIGQGSVGCTAIVQAAANGTTARVGADDVTILPPMSVTKMTCLNNFFSGIGLDVVTNLLDPTKLIQAVEGEICQMVNNAWQSMIGSVQCGLTITGFNFGFGGLGGGLSCPRLSFGGGGPPVASIGLGGSSGSGIYIQGSGLAPSGYIPYRNSQPGTF